MMTAMTARSVADLSAMCTGHGIQMRIYMLMNESLIPRARNYCADEFLRSGDSHLMFIDSDIGFNPQDVIAMLAMSSEESQYDILCGPYPKKCISWEKIKVAVDKGHADENPNELEKFVGDYVFNLADGATSFQVSEPVEVLESGTGFMLIKREALLKFAEAYPEQRYKPDHVRTEHFDGTREITAFFDCPIDSKLSNTRNEVKAFIEKNPKASNKDILEFVDDPENGLVRGYSNRYLSEDYMFCQWSRRIGLKVWLCPWIKLTHTGSYIFGGSLEDIAKLNVSPTADPSMLKKVKK